jgi:pimeloyl-ACP methyl ester carboxylesterase
MTLRFETTGSGPAKVLVTHNWMATIRSYDLARRHVDEQTFTYAFVDLRGYGLNRDVPGSHTAVEAARDLIEVADALGWNDFNVVGHSMSGMIAQRVCVEVPERVRSLVAITPVTAAGMPMDAQTKAVFTAATTQDEAWLGLADMFTSARLPKRWYAEELAAFRRDVDASGPLGYLEMLQGPAFADAMKGSPFPRWRSWGATTSPRSRRKRCARRSASGCRRWPSRPSKAADITRCWRRRPTSSPCSRSSCARSTEPKKKGPGPPLLRHAGAQQKKPTLR